jgi:signal transduction histidine kinase
MQQERQFKNLELEMRRRDGRLVSLVVDFVGAFDESGKLVEIHGYAQDVTEQRRVELQLQRAQKMEAVGQLAGGIAHDFNNLLGVMGGYAELVLRDLGQEHRSARRVGGILKAVERASALTRQLLTFSRHQPVETRVCDLNAVVENVEKMLRRLLGEDVRLVVALHHEIARVKADVGQLEQVIVNLAVNARDAMPDGGRLVIETGDIELDEHYTRTHPEAHPGSHVLLAVSDTGQGMDTQTVSRIFEPFFTTKAPGKGTGLGLSMVYGIVKRFGGHVAVYSEPGRGTTFKVYLPSVREGEAALPSEQAPRGAPPGGTETILLLEDDEALRSVIAETLRSSGYYVLEAPDADAALALAANAERPPQLLITDVVLPLRGGPVAAAELQARLPGVRVLFMSGYTDRTVERTGGIPVASHFLQKPFTNDALLWRVRAILDEPAIR